MEKRIKIVIDENELEELLREHIGDEVEIGSSDSVELRFLDKDGKILEIDGIDMIIEGEF